MAAAWALVIVGTIAVSPAAGILSAKKLAGAAGIVFLLAFAKTVMLDLRDMESDHLVGLETLPIWIGRNRAVLLLYLVHWSLFALILALGLTGFAGRFALPFALVPLYGGIAVYLLARARFQGEVNCQLAIDGQLLFAGAIPALWGAA